MAKKKASSPTAKSTRLIKLLVPSEDHDLIRLAAALRRSSMAEFAKTVVVEEAKRLTAGIALPK